MELKGRTAVISGASSGIGRALAHIAGANGMTVAICDVDAIGLRETTEWLEERQVKVRPAVVDVRDAAAVENFAKSCADLPDIAMVWANAGVLRYSSAIAPDLDAWNLIIDVNLKGVIAFMAAFVPRLIAAGQPSRFIITGSQASFMAAPEIGAYVATKHALWGLAETLRIELEQEGGPVGVSLLAPPRTATGIIATTMERVRAEKGDEGLVDFLQTLPQADAVSQYAWDRACAGDFLILPHFEEIADIVSARFAPFMTGGAA